MAEVTQSRGVALQLQVQLGGDRSVQVRIELDPMGVGDGDGVEIGDCSLDVVVASGRRVSGREGRQMIKRGLPRETGSHRMLRAAISIEACDQHVANCCVYLGDDEQASRQADATQTCDSWCDCYRGLANRMSVCNNQAANHTRECSAETGTRQRYVQDLLETAPVPAGRVGRLLVGEGSCPWQGCE